MPHDDRDQEVHLRNLIALFEQIVIHIVHIFDHLSAENPVQIFPISSIN